LACRV